MSSGLADVMIGLCVYAAVWLAAPGLNEFRHVAAAILLVVAIVVAAKYVP